MTIQELKAEVIAIVGSSEAAKAWVKNAVGDLRRRDTWEFALEYLKQAAQATAAALTSDRAQRIYKAVLTAVAIVAVVIAVGLYRAARGIASEFVVPVAVTAYRWCEDRAIEVWPMVRDRVALEIDASVGVWADLLVGL